MSAAPTVSVIVVCLNPGSRLAAALESVWAQRHVAAELIVVDGGSTDGTGAWLDRHRDKIATLIAGPDARGYDAMNQGVAAARGEWVYFFGAEDRLAGDMVLSETVNWMRKTEAGVVVGEAAFDDGRICKMSSHVNAIARNFVPRQSTFYRRALFGENGPFDTSLALMADYEFNVRLWKNRVRFKPIPLRVAASAARERFGWAACREEIRVRHRYFSAARCLVRDAQSLVRALGGSFAIARPGKTA